MSNHLLSIIITAYSGTNVDLFTKYFKYFFYEENDDREGSPWVLYKPDNDHDEVKGVYDLNYNINITNYNYSILKNIEFILVIDNKKDFTKEINLNEYINDDIIDKFMNTDFNNKKFYYFLLKSYNEYNWNTHIKPISDKLISHCMYLLNYIKSLNNKQYNKLCNFINKLLNIVKDGEYIEDKRTNEKETYKKIIKYYKDTLIKEIIFRINTKKIIDSFTSVMNEVNHTNYKIIYSNEPSSLSTSRNIGAKESTGEWLMFFDDDDPHINIKCIYNILIDYKDSIVYYDEKYINITCCVENKKVPYKYKFPCDVIWCATLNQDIAVWGKFYKREVFEMFYNNSSYYNEDWPFNDLVNAYFHVYNCYSKLKYAMISYIESYQYQSEKIKFMAEDGRNYTIVNRNILDVYLAMNYKRIIDLHEDDKDNFKYRLFINNCVIREGILSAYYCLYNDKLENYIVTNDQHGIYNANYDISDVIIYKINHLKNIYYNQNQVCSFTVIEPNKDPYIIYHSVGNSDESVENYLSKKYNYVKNDDKEINMRTINDLLTEHNETRYNLLGGFISLISLLLKITILIIIVCVIVLIFKQVKISSEV